MASRKVKKVHRKPKVRVSLAVLAGLAPTAVGAIESTQKWGWKAGVNHITRNMLGYDYQQGFFNAGMMKGGMLPLVLGIAVHKVAGMVGINRQIAKLGLPISV